MPDFDGYYTKKEMRDTLESFPDDAVCCVKDTVVFGLASMGSELTGPVRPQGYDSAFIYVLQWAQPGGLIKVGSSSGPLAIRRSSLSRENPDWGVSVLATIPVHPLFKYRLERIAQSLLEKGSEWRRGRKRSDGKAMTVERKGKKEWYRGWLTIADATDLLASAATKLKADLRSEESWPFHSQEPYNGEYEDYDYHSEAGRKFYEEQGWEYDGRG